MSLRLHLDLSPRIIQLYIIREDLIMRIKKGDKLAEIVLPRHDGTPFQLS